MPKITCISRFTLLIQPVQKHDGKGNPLPSYTSKIETKNILVESIKKKRVNLIVFKLHWLINKIKLGTILQELCCMMLILINEIEQRAKIIFWV